MKPDHGDLDYCTRLVREGDTDRYLSVLYAPRTARPHLIALYAFNLEITRIREVITEPAAGELRLEWWRETVGSIYRGDVADQPVTRLLASAIASANLPAVAFETIIEARRFDLYNEPVASMAWLESYASDTSSALLAMAARILAGEAAAEATSSAVHGGIAHALVRLLRNFSLHCRHGRIILPGDLLAQRGLSPSDVFSDKADASVAEVLTQMRGIAYRHLQDARTSAHGIPKSAWSAYLPLALVEPHLRVMEKDGFNPYRDQAELSPLKRQWLYLRAAWRGRF